MNQPQQCPCDSGKFFSKCCEPYLKLAAKPRTAKQLMRSRYSAYALGGYGDYLLHTWHPHFQGALNGEKLSEKTQRWLSLDIVDSTQSGNTAEVEFIARYETNEGVSMLHHERSRFVRELGNWLYTHGDELS